MVTSTVLTFFALCTIEGAAGLTQSKKVHLAGQPALRLRGGATPLPIVTQPSRLRGGESTSLELPTEAKLLIGSAGIFLSFSVFAVLQEDVYKKAYGGEFFAFTFFALLVERGINALTAFAGVSSLGASGLKIPYTAFHP